MEQRSALKADINVLVCLFVCLSSRSASSAERKYELASDGAAVEGRG